MNKTIISFYFVASFSISITHAFQIGFGSYSAQDEGRLYLENEKKWRETTKNDLHTATQLLIERCKIRENPLNRFESIKNCAECYKAFIEMRDAIIKLPLRELLEQTDNERRLDGMLLAIASNKIANFKEIDILEEMLSSGQLSPQEYNSELTKIPKV
jgi:hypothetical protein